MKIIQTLSNIAPIKNGVIANLSDEWTLRILSMGEDLLRIVVEPGTGLPVNKSWMIAPEGDVPWEGRSRDDFFGFNPSDVTLSQNGDVSQIVAGKFRVTVQSNPFRIAVEQKCDGGWKPWISDRETGGFALTERGQRIRHFQKRESTDRHFGLGDKTGPLDRTGRRYRVLQLDALGYDAEIGDPLYKHVPYLAVQNGAVTGGLFYDSLAPLTFDLGCERSNYHGIYRYVEIEERGMDLWLIAGPDLAGVTRRFTLLTGRPAMLPRWSFGFAFTTMHHADDKNAQAVIENFAERCRSEKIAISAIHFGSGYSSRGKRRYVFTWNKSKFPDAPALFKKLTDMGFPTVANIKPVLIDDHPDYHEIKSSGGFIKDEAGEPVVEQFWDGMGSYLDFTNSATIHWWQERLKAQVLNAGFAAGWNDNNEYEVGRDNSLVAGFGDPLDAPSIRPLHALLMTRATYEATQETKPGLRPYTITRAGPAGVQRYAETWTGDNETSWHTLKWNIYNGLSLALSGQSKIGHDIGGFSGPRPDPELLCRWVEMMALHPRAVMNSWKPQVADDWQAATTPWIYPEMTPFIRDALNLRTTFLPVMYSMAYDAHRTGNPIIRPLFFDFPDDALAYQQQEAFMLGPHVLFAPVVVQGAVAKDVYLPVGPDGWVEYHTGKIHKAGTSVRVDAPLGRPPIFIRAGSALVLSRETPYVKPHDAPARRIFLATASIDGEGTCQHFEDDGLSWDFKNRDYNANFLFSMNKVSVDVTCIAGEGIFNALKNDTWAVDGPFVRDQTINIKFAQS